MANYSSNPTNPANQPGGPVNTMGQGQTGVPVSPAQQQYVVPQQQPKTIREYLALARQGGWGRDPNAPAPRFTNIEGDTQGFNVNNRAQDWQMTLQPEAQQQAIPPVSPDNEYDKMPYNQKVKLSPYVRARERMQTALPFLWEQMFPGMPQGSELDESQMKQWQGAVAHVAGDLIKKYDSEYADHLANQKAELEKADKEYNLYNMKWLDLSKNGPVYKADGQTPYSGPEEFIQENIDRAARFRAANRIQEKELKKMGESDAKAAEPKQETYEQKVQRVKGDPQLRVNIQARVKGQLAKSMGKSMITQQEFQQIREKDPDLIERLTLEAIDYFES